MGPRFSNRRFLCRQQESIDWTAIGLDVFSNFNSAWKMNAIFAAIFLIPSRSMEVSPLSHLPLHVLFSLFLCPLLQSGDLLEEGRLDAVRIVGLTLQLNRENTRLVRRETEQATEKEPPRGSEAGPPF
jgi:hypothetical protein